MSYVITPEGWIAVPVTPDMMEAATVKAAELGSLRNSILGGKGNLTGFLGEEAVLRTIPGAIELNTYNFDMVIGDFRFEVKSKNRTVPPQPDFEGSIPNYNNRQRTDAYIFTSVTRDHSGPNAFHTVYLMGMTTPDEFVRLSQPVSNGSYDPSNNWTASAACRNIRYSELLSLAPLLE